MVSVLLYDICIISNSPLQSQSQSNELLEVFLHILGSCNSCCVLNGFSSTVIWVTFQDQKILQPGPKPLQSLQINRVILIKYFVYFKAVPLKPNQKYFHKNWNTTPEIITFIYFILFQEHLCPIQNNKNHNTLKGNPIQHFVALLLLTKPFAKYSYPISAGSSSGGTSW